MELYKKTAVYSRELYFTQFKMLLVAVMREINANAMESFKKEFDQCKKAFSQLTELS